MPAVTSSTLRVRIASARILIMILKLSGLWQWPEDRTQREHSQFLLKFQRIYFVILHLPLTFAFITLMAADVLLSQNLDESSNVLFILLAELSLITKIWNIWHHGTLAWYYMDELAHEPTYAFRKEFETKQWQRDQRSFAVIAYGYILGSFAVNVFACIGAMLTPAGTYVLPVEFYMPFEWRHPRNYWYALSYGTVSAVLTSIYNSTLDMVFCYFMFHLSLLYKLIGWRLATLKQRRNDVGSAEVIDEMRDIFKVHECVNRLSVRCQTLVSLPLFAQIVLSAFILCFTGYHLQHMNFMENISSFVSIFQFLSVMTFQIYLPCYYSNAVKVNSNALTNEIFNSDWTEFDLPTRRFMIIYMELLKRPVALKAGNLFEVGLPIFTKTMNNAYSYFALLLNLNN